MRVQRASLQHCAARCCMHSDATVSLSCYRTALCVKKNLVCKTNFVIETSEGDNQSKMSTLLCSIVILLSHKLVTSVLRHRCSYITTSVVKLAAATDN
jgi:hypothetical protein